MPIPPLNKTVDFSYCVIDLNDFIEKASEVILEVGLVSKRGRYERTSSVEIEKVILH